MQVKKAPRSSVQYGCMTIAPALVNVYMWRDGTTTTTSYSNKLAYYCLSKEAPVPLGCMCLGCLQGGCRGSCLPRPAPAPPAHSQDLLLTLLPVLPSVGTQSGCGFGGCHSSGTRKSTIRCRGPFLSSLAGAQAGSSREPPMRGPLEGHLTW